jgi:hypothetical protein
MPLGEAGPEACRQWLATLGDQLREISTSDALAQNLAAFRQAFRYHRGGFDLPADVLTDTAERRFGVIVRNLQVVNNGGAFTLQSPKGAAPVPADLAGPISWIVDQGNFSPAELAAEYPKLTAEVRDKLIARLTAMKAIAPD